MVFWQSAEKSRVGGYARTAEFADRANSSE
jgi:hypothetical protein